MSSSVDLSRVTNLAQRIEIERLFLASEQADKVRDDLSEKILAADLQYLQASAAADQALDAYNDAEGPGIISNEDGIDRCAVSGLALLDDDELLVDEDTGEMVLRCLLLPPRPVSQEDEEDDDEEEDDRA